MYLQELKLVRTDKRSMQVKLFVHHSLDEVENRLNEWLAGRFIDVCHITQSQCEKQGRFVFVLSVFFKERQTESSSVQQREDNALTSLKLL